jgi:O-antigen/teichoic acid export membrane protein
VDAVGAFGPAESPAERLEPPSAAEATRKQIRGSSLLLAGRLLALVVNFAVQVLIVRYLTKSSYGAFAYALSVAGFGQVIIRFGLDRAVTRFVPIYDERGEHQRIFGVLALVAGTVATWTLALVSCVYAFQGLIGEALIDDKQTVSLLLILIFLAPIEALDDLLTGLFAVFARAQAIFFRRYVLTPGLRLVVVLVLLLSGSGGFFLAAGYVVAGAVGTSIYMLMLIRILRASGMLARFNRETIAIPAREVLAFTVPLLTTDLVYAAITVSDAVLLGHFRGPADVGALRAVQPAAMLNQLVFSSFLFLFTPAAARLFAHDDRASIGRLYWRTTAWIALMSFPIFLLTFSLARPLTLLLFGHRYESSALLLMILSTGYYVQAALGFNGTTLMIFGRLRYIVVLNLFAVIVNLAANVLLIPRWGATGAAVGTASTLVAHNLLKQAALRLATGIPFLERSLLRVYVSIAIGAAVVLAVERLVGPPVVGFAFAAVVAVSVLALNRGVLELRTTFPELMRMPLLRRIAGE